MKIIKERYKYCYSVIRGKNDGATTPYALLRDPIEADVPFSHVHFIIEDGFGFLYRKRALLLANIAAK